MSNMRRIALALLLFACAGCQTTSTHQFAAPAAEWKTKSGQLSYKSPQVSLLGDVVVRYSEQGDFQLTFSKGPGLTLITLRQDAGFASAEGPLARGGWAGPIGEAPERLRGWFGLREKVLAGSAVVETTAGGDRFNLRF